MPKPDKKQRHRAKRQARRRDTRRRGAVSPLKQLAEAAGDVECFISADFEQFGQCQIVVYKQAGTLSGLTCFLLDRGVVGLKDAWTRLDLPRKELRELLADSNAAGLKMRPASPEEFRRLIAGGLRWVRQHGLKEPDDWPKPAALLGGVSEIATADVSPFVKEFAGQPDDLRQRLVGSTFDAFVARDDIAFDFDDAATFMDQATDDYIDPNAGSLNDVVADLPDTMLARMKKRLRHAAEALARETDPINPSAMLVEVWTSLMLAVEVSRAAYDDEREAADRSSEVLDALADRIPESDQAAYHAALEFALTRLDADPDAMQRAVEAAGLGE